MTTADLLSRLEGVKRAGKGWKARCPAHDDSNPSLAVEEGQKGILLTCHAGCSFEAICGALGLQPSDLFHENGKGKTSRLEIIAEYNYTDENGNLLFQVVRISPKDFRQRRPDGKGDWIWNIKDTRRVLYRLPTVVEAVALGKTVYIAEGEKDVHALEAAGAVATCNPGGAGKWRPEYTQALQGATVKIIADRDDTGRKHAADVAHALREGCADVEVVEPAGGKDAHDHFEAGHGLDDFRPTNPTEGEEEQGSEPEDAFPLLAHLLSRPELLDPPEEVLPRLAWRGRATGLVGPDKSGKSTLAAHAVAALTTGGFWLGDRVQRGTAVVAAPDEAVGDTVRRLHELGAAPDRVRILTLRPPNLLLTLDELLQQHPASLVVVDSLAEWARLTLGTAPDDGDASGWGSVVRPLVGLSRERDCAILLLHHPRRSDGQYRGSGEIAAALDCLLEMTLPQNGEDPTLRRFRGRARWPIEDFSIRMEEERFTLGSHGGPVPIEARILMDTAANPSTSRTAQFGRLGGRKQTYLTAVAALVDTGGLVDREGRLFTPGQVEEDLL